jgi:hypothetical protein
MSITFYSQAGKDHYEKRQKLLAEQQALAEQRRQKQAEIDANSREAANRAIQQEQVNKPAAQPSISWSEYYKL